VTQRAPERMQSSHIAKHNIAGMDKNQNRLKSNHLGAHSVELTE